MEWAKAKPMNCEEMMIKQVDELIPTNSSSSGADPTPTAWIYRNAAKALAAMGRIDV